MKKKILLLSLIILLLGTLLILTGCSNKEETAKAENQEESVVGDNEKSTQDENKDKVAIRLNGTADFEYDMATVSETIEFKQTNYVIGTDFKVLTTYQNNYGYVGGFQIRQNEDKSYSILDKTGKEVLSYGEHEYEKVELLDNGCAFIKNQTDTYNSSTTVGGIYDLAQGKYVLDPSEKYLNLIKRGESMYQLDDDWKVYFNTKTKKVITYEKGIAENFNDGYALDSEYSSEDDCYYLLVWDDNGGFKKIKATRSLAGVNKKHNNGMLFYSDMEVYHAEDYTEKIRMHSALYNLETGEVFNFGTEEYSMPTNDCKFTKEGYGLLTFNNQGGTPYYTILDKKGNKLFEPIKVNDNALFQPKDNGEKRIIRQTELYDGNYLIVEEDGVDTVLDINNKVIIQAEQYEKFEGITNGAIKVKREQSGYYDEYYYKDLQGNKIQIYK